MTIIHYEEGYVIIHSSSSLSFRYK